MDGGSNDEIVYLHTGLGATATASRFECAHLAAVIRSQFETVEKLSVSVTGTPAPARSAHRKVFVRYANSTMIRHWRDSHFFCRPQNFGVKGKTYTRRQACCRGPKKNRLEDVGFRSGLMKNNSGCRNSSGPKEQTRARGNRTFLYAAEFANYRKFGSEIRLIPQ